MVEFLYISIFFRLKLLNAKFLGGGGVRAVQQNVQF